jgi:hypothetical protein
VIERCTFNEILQTRRLRAPEPMDPIQAVVDLFHGFSNRKINRKLPKIARAWYFYKNTPEFFQNYILVPIILHLGP